MHLERQANVNMTESKILLFIVEGKSDEASLAPALEQIVDKTTKFKVIQSDITSDFYSNPSNIERRIKKKGIKEFLSKNSQFTEKDICGVVHIVDMDGAFASDTLVQKDNTVENVIYEDDKILETDDKYESFIKSRDNKRNNINALLKINSLKLKENHIVSYEMYFMSCNLDHVLHGKRNYTAEEKRLNSEKFASKYFEPQKFIDFFNQDIIKIGDNYDDTWNYIKTDNNSLMRHSNLNICIDKHKKKTILDE